MNTNASYFGESGDSAYSRSLKHLEAVKKDDPKNSALAMHLREYHQTRVGHEEAFKLKVLKTFKKPMERQVAEAVLINNSTADITMNRKRSGSPPSLSIYTLLNNYALQTLHLLGLHCRLCN